MQSGYWAGRPAASRVLAGTLLSAALCGGASAAGESGYTRELTIARLHDDLDAHAYAYEQATHARQAPQFRPTGP
jgi:hypothetical protein